MAAKSDVSLKQPLVQKIKDNLAASKGAVLADYRGLNVAQITDLRRQLREAGVEYKVVKNTLTRLAASELGIEGLDSYLEGPTAIAYGKEDAVAPAKILSEFAKINKDLEIKAGILDGKVIDLQSVKALAALPSREVLLAKVLGGMQAPMYGFANVLSANLRNFVYVLEAVRAQKAGE